MTLQDYLKIPFRWLFRISKTYSQTGEDAIVNFFLSDVKKGFYVDIGANDPIHLNNTYLFYKKGWSGLCVEPNSTRCKIFRAVRPRDEVICCGAGPERGSMEFYVFDLDNISTFDKYEAEEFQKVGHKIVQTLQVPVFRLSEILDTHAAQRAIDLLSVDTEGLDLKILQSNDWQKFRPKIIVVETAEYRKEAAVRTHRAYNEYLQSVGYIKVADTYINGVYMDQSYAEHKHITNILS